MIEREQRTPDRPAAPARMLRVGGVTFLGSVLVLLLPLLVPLGGAAKYVVVPALIGACFGLGCVLNGIIDAVKRRE